MRKDFAFISEIIAQRIEKKVGCTCKSTGQKEKNDGQRSRHYTASHGSVSDFRYARRLSLITASDRRTSQTQQTPLILVLARECLFRQRFQPCLKLQCRRLYQTETDRCLSASHIPETFDWFEDIIDYSCNQSVLISEIKSCPGM